MRETAHYEALLRDTKELSRCKHIRSSMGRIVTMLIPKMPASVAHLDARPTGDQKVMGSTPHGVGSFLSWRLIMKYFLRSFTPFR